MNDSTLVNHQSDPVKRARLRWRARRGLLENDLILTRYLDKYELTMTDDEVEAFTRLMELSDNELMGLLIGNKEPEAAINSPSIHALLGKIRSL